MKTIIMSGGLGKRAESIDSSIPKPLIRINDKPILQWEIECLVKQGLTDIIFTVSYKADAIVDYFEDGSKFGCQIDYFHEEQPLGNAGALFKLWQEGTLNEDFLLLNADSMFNIDFERFIKFHQLHHALATLFTHPNNHPYDSGLIIADKNDVVSQWLAKEDERPEWYKNCVNAGVHILNTELLEIVAIDADSIDSFHKIDLDRDVLKPQVKTGRIFAYNSPEYVKDMGTPERFVQVQRELSSGIVEAHNLKRKQKAVFLDRDGTINKYVGFLRNIDDFELLNGVAEAIRRLNESGYLVIVVTNQPVIARGEVTVEELSAIHDKMETLLGQQGAYLDAIYYCPHHPDKGFKGEIEFLKIDCDCRKPKPGMLLKAAEDFNIDLSQSWMIGDSWSDVKAGISVGCYTLKIRSAEPIDDKNETSVMPFAYIDDLLRAVKLINAFDKLNTETIDPLAKYVLFNKVNGQPLWFCKKDAEGRKNPNGETFVWDLTTAVTLFIHQENSDDLEIVSMDRYARIREAQMEIQSRRMDEIKANAREIPVAQIEYKDFLFIDIMSGLTTRIIKFTNYLEWLAQSDFKALDDRLKEGLNLKHIPKRSNEDVIEGIVAKNDKDFEKKAVSVNYYICSYIAIMDVVRHIFSKNTIDTLKAADSDDKARFLTKSYQNLLIELLLNVEDLCSLYSEKMGNHEYQSLIRSRFISTMAVHQVLRQELYGNVSLHSFTDRETSASIGTIRQLVELRIRRSFGVLSFVDTDDNFAPLDMKMIFNAIKRHKDEVELPIKLENIIRIYSWANNYIHSGLGDYPWISFFLERMLRDFSFGMKKKGGWNVHNGIRMKKETIDMIQQEILDARNTNKDGNKTERFRLYTCEPECEITTE